MRNKIIIFLFPPLLLLGIITYHYVKSWQLYKPNIEVIAMRARNKVPISVYVSFIPGFKSFVHHEVAKLAYATDQKKTAGVSVDIPIGEIGHSIILKNLKYLFREVYFLDEERIKKIPKNAIKLRIFTPKVTVERVYWDDPIGSYVECDYELTTADGRFIFYYSSRGFGSKRLYEHLGYISQTEYYKEAITIAFIRSYNEFVSYIQDPNVQEKIYKEKIIIGE